MKAVCIHQITVGNANTLITYVCWYGREHPDPNGKVLKHGQSKSKTSLLFTILLEYIEDAVND